MGGIIHFTRSWMPCALALALSSTPAKSQSSNDTPGRTPIQIGLLRLRPSGFLESTGVLRSAASGDDMSTRFGSIPLESSGGESLVSFRNSRMALLGEVPLSEALKVSGYAEADFLNRPPNEPFRWRQYYGKLQWGDWEVLAGQAWSFLRPNRLRISSEGDLMNTRVVDAGYHVGLLGSRRRQVRVTRRMGAWQAGISVENGKDFLPKLVHDGKRTHLELIGLAGRGGRRGMSIAAVAHATSKLDLVTQQFYSSGGGPDALSTIPAGIRVLSTLEGAERTGVRAAFAGESRGARVDHRVLAESLGRPVRIGRVRRPILSDRSFHLGRPTRNDEYRHVVHAPLFWRAVGGACGFACRAPFHT